MRQRRYTFSDVVISRGDGDLLEILRKNVNMLGGIEKYVKPGNTVFIKPNLTAGMPCSTGGTTDVKFAEAVVELVKEANPGHIIVGECSGNESRSIESLLNNGYGEMCERQQVEMMDLDYAEFVDVPVKNPLYADVIPLPKAVVEADVYISLPVIKTHLSCGVSIALKNSFGLVPDDMKIQAHRDNAIEQILVDIAQAQSPDLIFADGRIGAEGVAGGSDFRFPRPANVICVSDDPVAMDTVCARLMRQNTRVRYIQWAGEMMLGNDSLDYINIHGLSIDEASVKFMSPAEQIEMETQGKIKIHELNPCTKCRALGEGGVWRFASSPNSLLEPVDIVIGPGKWEVPENLNPRTILLGDCIRKEYRDKGVWIGGCPAESSKYYETLASYNIVCTRCAEKVKEAMKAFTEDELATLRILASNNTVFRGASNKAGMEDFLLAVGDCQKGYCHNHIRRCHKLSDVDAGKYIEQVLGCGDEVTVESIREGIRVCLEKAKAEGRC